MDPTALPTDNLYKFMALAGLALAGFCAWAIWKVTRFIGESAMSLAEGDVRLHARRRNLETFISLTPTGAGREQEIIDRGLLLDEELAIQEARAKLVTATICELNLRTKTLKRAIGAGLTVSAAGFTLWYLNVQWYADKQAKADFEDHMQELAAKRIAREKPAREPKP